MVVDIWHFYVGRARVVVFLSRPNSSKMESTCINDRVFCVDSFVVFLVVGLLGKNLMDIVTLPDTTQMCLT
jgi:hypothetical protein